MHQHLWTLEDESQALLALIFQCKNEGYQQQKNANENWAFYHYVPVK
jgi:hypothetical protein